MVEGQEYAIGTRVMYAHLGGGESEMEIEAWNAETKTYRTDKRKAVSPSKLRPLLGDSASGAPASAEVVRSVPSVVTARANVSGGVVGPREQTLSGAVAALAALTGTSHLSSNGWGNNPAWKHFKSHCAANFW